jgi:hypothetical protein
LLWYFLPTKQTGGKIPPSLNESVKKKLRKWFPMLEDEQEPNSNLHPVQSKVTI